MGRKRTNFDTNHEHYQKYKEQYYNRAMKKQTTARAYLNAIKLSIGCQRCGYKEDSCALEFHHLNPDEKLFTIGRRPSVARSKLDEEIAKCCILCSNCHKVITHRSEKRVEFYGVLLEKR